MAAEEVPIRHLALEILVEHALVFAVGFARKVARGTQLFVVLAQLSVVKAFVAYHHQSARIIKQADDHEKEFGKPLVDVSVAFGQVCCPEPQVVPSTRRMTFLDKLNQRIAKTGSNLCVGLDVRAENAEETTKRWILDVIAQTAPFAAAFKPNSAYFEALGWRGVKMLEEILKEIPKEIPVVLDVKRGDIGETQGYYAKACFDVMNVDAVTLNAYMGRDTLEPFLKYTDKGLYLLGVTSNPGAKDIELQRAGDRQVYELVAGMTKGHPQAGLVVGLTNAAPDVLDHIPDVPLLIPGLGAQGGDLAALKGSGRKAPLLVNVSRGVLYQKDELSFAQRAEYWMRQIQQALA